MLLQPAPPKVNGAALAAPPAPRPAAAPETTLAERLRIVRMARGLTQQQMADLLGVKRPSVTQLEGGRHRPSHEVLETIVRKLEVSRTWLWFGAGPMEEETPGLAGNARLVAPVLEDVPYADFPFVSIPVRAGFVDLIAAEGDYGQLDTVRIYNPSPELQRPGTMVVEIDGDSMEPQLRPGMQVAVVPVALENCKYATSGVYVVAFGNQLTVKRIKDNELLTKGRLVLHSDNPKAGSLAVPGDEIRGMWRVLEIVRGRVE